MYKKISEKLVTNYNRNDLQYGIFTGDFNQEPDSIRGIWPWAVGGWVNARKIFEPLFDNNIPFGVLAGNHDTIGGYKDNSMSLSSGNFRHYTDYFGKEKFKNIACYKECYDKGNVFGDNIGHYDLIRQLGSALWKHL